MKMRNIWKYIIISSLVLLAVHVFLLNDNSSINQLSGIYVRDINCKDTLKLYPDGKMEQVIFNKDNKLVYSCISNVSILFSALTRMFPKPTFAP